MALLILCVYEVQSNGHHKISMCWLCACSSRAQRMTLLVQWAELCSCIPYRELMNVNSTLVNNGSDKVFSFLQVEPAFDTVLIS